MNTSISMSMADSPSNSVTATIKKYSQQIFGFIRSRVNNTDDARDILQDVWYQLSRLTDLDQIESMSGWLYRVARNRITDNYRKNRPESLEGLGSENGEGEFSVQEILLADESGDPELGLFKQMFWEELRLALDELPINQREVFVKNEFEDQTLQQIADESGVGLKTIISRKGYAVKHLRRRMEYLYNELND